MSCRWTSVITPESTDRRCPEQYRSLGTNEVRFEESDLRALDREIARLAIPALATLLAEPLYVLADTAVVGHIGDQQLAGLALASTVMLTGYSVFVFLAYGTTSAVARLLGAGSHAQAAHQAVQSLWLAVLLGIVMTTLGLIFGDQLLVLLGADGEVLSNAWVYLHISLYGAPALMIALAGTGYLRGLQNTRMPLIVTLAGAVLNLSVELVLIFGLGFGIGASAFASVVAQWLVAGVYARAVLRSASGLGVRLRPNRHSIQGLAGVGADLVIRTLALRSSLVVSTAVAARLGVVSLAAYQIAFEIWNFMAMALDALAIAAQAMIGRLLGAVDAPAAKIAGRRLLQLGFAAGLLGAAVIAAVSTSLPQLFSPNPEVTVLTAALLLWVAALQPINAMAFVLDGILIGAGDTRFLAIAMTIAAAVFIPLAVLVGVAGAAVQWLWALLGILMAIRTATLGKRYMTGAWARTGALN